MPEHGKRVHDTQENGMMVRDMRVHDTPVHDSWRHKKLSFPPL